MNPMVYAIDGVTPVVDPTAYVHPSAVLIGDVWVAANCYIGPFASLRGDFGRIEVRAGANVQDSCVMHGFPARTRSSRRTATSATVPSFTVAPWVVMR